MMIYAIIQFLFKLSYSDFCKIKGTVGWCGLVEEYTTDLIHTCIIILYSIAGITLASIKFGEIALHWYWQSGDLDAYHHMRAYIIWRIFNLVI